MTHSVSDKDSGGGIAIQTKALDHLEAVAFDLDSTLSYYPFSTQDVLREALHRVGEKDLLADVAGAAERYNAAWPEAERRCNSILETRIALWAMLLDRPIDSLCRQLALAYDEIRQEGGVELFPGVRQMLSSLRSKYRVGLLTNGSAEMQRPKLEHLGIASAFDAVVLAGEEGVYKPASEVFDILLDRLNAKAEVTLFVGDSYEMDIVGAHRAGMRTAWVKPDDTVPGEDITADIEIGDVSLLREVLL